MHPRPVFGLLATVAVLAWVAAACGLGGNNDPDLTGFFDDAAGQSEAAPAAATDDRAAAEGTQADPALLDLSIAPRTALEAVQKFYALVAAQRFEDAYRLVSLEARETISAEQFAERYRDIWDEVTVQSLTWSVTPPPGENVAGVEVTLRYETAFFGPVEERIFAPTRRQPNWVVDWSPDLVFEGLGERGFLIHRFIDTPERGDIRDRNGVALATKGEVAVIGISRELVTDDDAVIETFVERFDLDEETARNLFYQDVPQYFFIPLVRLQYDSDPALVQEFEQLADRGILVQRETRRIYPQGTLAAHVIGFLAEINAEELETLAIEGYQSGDLVGRDGIEAIFEPQLAGTRGGSLTILSPDGRVVREIATRPAVAAQDVWLTIDARVQRVAELALGDRPGAVVALDPRNGEILAMASFPTFEPDAFVRGLTEEEFSRYFEDPLLPFTNRPSERLYPPGSTFKVVTEAAGLEVGGYTPESRISCPAVWDGLGPDNIKVNWKEDDRGNLTLNQALAESCNTVFYQVGVALHELGEDILTQFAAGFGFGEPTGIIGVREEAGVNPGPEWKRIQRNDFWYTGDTVNLSIGQGFLLATPLQITNAYAALASDGILRTPTAVLSLRAPEGEVIQTFASTPLGVLPVSAETLAVLRTGMRNVIASRLGTGWLPFRGTPLLVAGKSGTAEDLGEQSHALFVAYANTPDPKLVVTVVLDDGESGADDAGPIARQILEVTMLSGWVP